MNTGTQPVGAEVWTEIYWPSAGMRGRVPLEYPVAIRGEGLCRHLGLGS